jgi:hypothetical protein
MSPSPTLFVKKRSPDWWNSQGFEKWGFLCNPFFLDKMKKDSAKSEFDFKVRLRMPPELVKWLIGAILMGGGAATAAAHWIN